MDPSQSYANCQGQAIHNRGDNICSGSIEAGNNENESAECGLQPSELDFAKRDAEAKGLMCKNRRGWRKIVRNFTPS